MDDTNFRVHRRRRPTPSSRRRYHRTYYAQHPQPRRPPPLVVSKEWFNADEDEDDADADEITNVAFRLNMKNPVAVAREVVSHVPEVSHFFVLDLCEHYAKHAPLTDGVMSDIITTLHMIGDYERQEDATPYHRSAANLNEDRLYDDDRAMALKLLANEFLDVPKKLIECTLDDEFTIRKTHKRLWIVRQSKPLLYRKQNRQFEEIPLAPDVERNRLRARLLMREMRQVRCEEREIERRLRDSTNEFEAERTGQIQECQICCFDRPKNRFAICNGPDAHQVCYICVSHSVDIEVGRAKCHPTCIASTDCKVEYPIHQLQEFINRKTMKGLLKMQQHEEVLMAGLPDLKYCPFCSFMACCDESDDCYEFKCPNPRCKRTSCLACENTSHEGQTCAENQKAQAPKRLRHAVEEAMSRAYVRRCNKCNFSFIKKEGCNRMSCSRCANEQCYVCGANADYSHFGRPQENKCPLNDTDMSLAQRHERDTRRAAEAAIAAIRAANPDVDMAEYAPGL